MHKKTNKYGIISLIIVLVSLGIAFILSRFIISGIYIDFSLITLFISCIISIILYFKQRKLKTTKIATTGLILAILGLILGIYVIVDVFNPIYDPLVCGFQSCDNRQENAASVIISNAKTVADCDKIRGYFQKYNRYRCYSNIATMTKNPQLCLKIEFVPAKDRCYYSLAVYTLDHTLCENIAVESNIVSKSECYEQVDEKLNERAYFDNKPALCIEVKNTETQTLCYFRIIKKLTESSYGKILAEDPTLCEKISDSELQKKCVAKINEWENGPKLVAVTKNI